MEKFKTDDGSQRRNRRDVKRLLSTCEDTRRFRSMSVDRGRSRYEDTNRSEEPITICSEELDCCPHHGQCDREDCHKMVSMYVFIIQTAVPLFILVSWQRASKEQMRSSLYRWCISFDGLLLMRQSNKFNNNNNNKCIFINDLFF